MALEIDDINLGGTLSATTISATTIVYDGQPIQNVFVQEIPGGFLANSGGTVTGSTVFTSGLSANTITATTYFGDGSNLTGIVGGQTTYVQPGSNITTGGTATHPIVSLVDSPSIFNLSLSGNVSASTIYGSSSNFSIFKRLTNETQSSQSSIAFVHKNNNGANISQGFGAKILLGVEDDSMSGTPSYVSSIRATRNGNNTTGNLEITTYFNGVDSIRGVFDENGLNVLSGLTGSTIYSGATNLYNIFQPIGSSLTGSYLNLSGGTVTGNTVFTQGLTANTISAGTLTVNGQLTGNDGAVFSGQINAATLSATTLSASNATVLSSFKFTTSPTAGYVLTTDANGNGTWQASPTSGSGTTKLDFQSVSNQATTPTATGSLVDVAGMSLTARNLGSSATTYYINFTGDFSNSNNAGSSTFRIVKNGSPISGALTNLTNAGAAMAGAIRTVSIACDATGVTNGDIIKVQMSASTGTVTARNKSLNIIGILNSNIV